MSPIMASISRKSSYKVPIIIFQMLLAGRRTHNNRALFYGFKGVVMGLIMGSQKIMGSDYGSNICEDMRANIDFDNCAEKRINQFARKGYCLGFAWQRKLVKFHSYPLSKQ
jgi:hypothetical protein